MITPQASASDPMVVVDGVSRFIHGVPVLDDISLTVRKGEFVSILGPTGSGKSTLFRILAGFDRPDRGRVVIAGRDMAGVPPFERDLTMVVQHFALFPHMTVQQNVEFGLEMRGVDAQTRRRVAAEMLEQVGLKGLGDRAIHQLSGGQRQRVALARALVTRPSVLLLDEPLGALDANLRIKMQGELKRLNKHLGITFVLVTGNQSEALAMSDRVVVMNDGRVEQVGSPQEVFRSPRTAFVAEFMGNFNVLRGEVQSATSELVQVRTCGGTLQAHPDGFVPARGSRCALLVRTDLPQLGVFRSAATNQVSGRVAQMEFTGSLLTVRVELPDGTLFRLEKHRSVEPTLHASMRHGDEITLSWPAHETRLIAHQGG